MFHDNFYLYVCLRLGDIIACALQLIFCVSNAALSADLSIRDLLHVLTLCKSGLINEGLTKHCQLHGPIEKHWHCADSQEVMECCVYHAMCCCTACSPRSPSVLISSHAWPACQAEIKSWRPCAHGCTCCRETTHSVQHASARCVGLCLQCNCPSLAQRNACET